MTVGAGQGVAGRAWMPTRAWATTLTGRPVRLRGESAVPGVVLAAWGALVFNVLAFGLRPTLVPIPQLLGQLMTQGSLVLAFVLALAANPRGVVRPNVVLVLLTLLGFVAVLVSIHNDFILGSAYRALRYLGFVAVLWLLTPWWGRRDMVLLRCHLRCYWVVLGSVFLGAALAPGTAFAFEGRLSGVIWPIAPTQVAHYAGVLFGVSAILWLSRVTSGWHALVALGVTGVALVATHTRTAAMATVLALTVAAASLFLGHVRVRRVSAWGAVLTLTAATLFASSLTAWALRGQSAAELSQLTGRTEVWTAALAMPRTQMTELFGTGMSDQSYNGLPIDSNWVATYVEQGWFGIFVQACVLALLLLTAAVRPRGPQRATALFLLVYCIAASVTETGLGTTSPYLLDLVVAATLLATGGTKDAR